MARVVVQNSKIRFAGSEIIHLVLPDRLHLEIHDPLGGVQMLLTAKGKRGGILFPGRSSARSFSPRSRSLNRLLGVDLTLSGLIRILAGTAPLPPLTPDGIRSEPDGNDVIVSILEKGRVRERVRTDGRGNVLRWDRMNGRGAVEASLFFEDFREVEGVRFPFGIRLEQGGKPVLSIRYRSIFLNRPLDPKLFEVPPAFPEGSNR